LRDLLVPRKLLLAHVQNKIARPNAYLVPGRLHFRQNDGALESFSVVLVDNDFIARLKHYFLVFAQRFFCAALILARAAADIFRRFLLTTASGGGAAEHPYYRLTAARLMARIWRD
jgi:hypothetical protein